MYTDRRPAQRFSLRAPVEFRGSDVIGAGTIWNISRSGALVEWATAAPSPGTRIGLQTSYYPGSSAIELWSEVVRTTERGFAVRFINLGASARTLLQSVLPERPPSPEDPPKAH